MKKAIKKIQDRTDLTDRKKANLIKKEIALWESEINQKPVEYLTISITWKKSRTWGANPCTEATIKHLDGSHSYATATCSGCGYDKESTVIADIFNQCLKYRLHALARTKKEVPYGVRLPGEYLPYYDGGIGTSCYYRIAEFIGGKFEKITSGKMFDVYRLTMKKGR